MNYELAYSRLIDRARAREMAGYIERHHVVPRCLGGGNEKANIVRLPPEEHYVAHQLLVKMYPGNVKLSWAAISMTMTRPGHQARRNKLYGWLRRRLAANMIGKKTRPHSVETKSKMSAASIGRKKSDAHCAALGAAKLGRKRGPHSEIHKQRLSTSVSRSLSTKDYSDRREPGYRAKQSAITTQVWARRRAEEASRSSLILPAGGL